MVYFVYLVSTYFADHSIIKKNKRPSRLQTQDLSITTLAAGEGHGAVKAESLEAQLGQVYGESDLRGPQQEITWIDRCIYDI